VDGSGSETLIIRALTFLNGLGDNGGGANISNVAIVEINLCLFSNCRATSSGFGGGAIYLKDSSTSINLYSTRFTDNTDSGNFNDIWRYSSTITITIHNICPSPYTTNTPTQAVEGSPYSYSGCFYECPAGQFNPSGGATDSSCEACPAGKYTTSSGKMACFDCEVGTYSGPSSDSCTHCPAGRYQTDPFGADENTACTGCPIGTYSEAEGSVNVDMYDLQGREVHFLLRLLLLCHLPCRHLQPRPRYRPRESRAT